jgi:endonuclease/exonuclease/phosphatase family metal-dependent hydrolase
MRRWFAVLVALSLAAAGTGGANADDDNTGSTAGDEFAVLSYNVHGLFRVAAKDDPRDRMPAIGWLSRRYQVVLYQEDFEYHDLLSQQLSEHESFVGNGVAGDVRRILAKLIAMPITMWIPRFSPPYGAGISTAIHHRNVVLESRKDHYHDCHGWFGANGDCWAAKGYLMVRFRTPAGAEIDVYNTHLEAGGTEASGRARRNQLDELATAIEKYSERRAVIVSGDYNIGWVRPQDRDMVSAFRSRLGLADTGAGPETPFWRERDFILYRGGATTSLTSIRGGEATEYVSEGMALSDHPALYAEFRAGVIAP